MEDTLFAIIRMASSVITVLGILWFAIQYFVKYKVNKMSASIIRQRDQKYESTRTRLRNVEEKAHSLDLRVTKVEDKIDYLSKK